MDDDLNKTNTHTSLSNLTHTNIFSFPFPTHNELSGEGEMRVKEGGSRRSEGDRYSPAVLILSPPIRGQYSGHVTCIGQSEASNMGCPLL